MNTIKTLCNMRQITFTLAFLLFIIAPLGVYANANAEEYIKRYGDLAVREMKRTGIPASITLAQGMFESQYGKSELASIANNHFGIKCKSNWTGATFKVHDDKPDECFKKYETAYDSYIDHSDLLKSRTWYQFLFLLEPTDYKSWAAGLLKAGYATDTLYAKKLIDVIERYELNELDKTVEEVPLVVFAQTIGINPESEAASKDYHSARLRGEMPAPNTKTPAIPTAKQPTKIVEPAKASQSAIIDNTAVETAYNGKPKRTTDLPQSDMIAMETAFSQAEAARPAGTQRQTLSGAPAISINPQELATSRIDPRRPVKANETPTPAINYQAQPLANNENTSTKQPENALVAKFENPTPTQQQENIEVVNYTTIQYPSSNNNIQQANTNDNEGAGFNSQITYQPAVQQADAEPNIVLAAYHNEPAPQVQTVAQRATSNNTNQKPVLSYLNERRIVTYPYEVSLSEVAAKHDAEISLLQNYNKGMSPKNKIAAGTPIFLQAPIINGY